MQTAGLLEKSLMLGEIEGRRRRGRQRMRRLDGISDAMDVNLGKLWEMVRDREAWHAAVHGITKSHTRTGDWTTRVPSVRLHYLLSSSESSCSILPQIIIDSPIFSSFVHIKILFFGKCFKKYCMCIWGYFYSVAQSCLTLCDPMDCSTPGLSVPYHLAKFAQVNVHCIGDVIQPSHPLMPSSPSAINLSQHQGAFQLVGSSHQMTKILELQHQSFQLIFRIDFP